MEGEWRGETCANVILFLFFVLYSTFIPELNIKG